MKITSLPFYVYKSSMPNICQVDPQIKTLKENGRLWCGPVAASNALFHLAKKHFQMLIPPMGKSSELEAQTKLVEQLVEYMQTNDSTGTETADLLMGLEKYIRERGYKARTSWEGWDMGKNCPIGKPPSISNAMQGLIGTSNTILQIGWYKPTLTKVAYRRVGGHYVNATGFIRKELNNEFIIHDPSPRSKQVPKHCTPNQISDEIVCLLEKSKKTDASEYNELEGIDINKNKGASIAVLDGIGIFKVFRK